MDSNATNAVIAFVSWMQYYEMLPQLAQDYAFTNFLARRQFGSQAVAHHHLAAMKSIIEAVHSDKGEHQKQGQQPADNSMDIPSGSSGFERVEHVNEFTVPQQNLNSNQKSDAVATENSNNNKTPAGNNSNRNEMNVDEPTEVAIVVDVNDSSSMSYLPPLPDTPPPISKQQPVFLKPQPVRPATTSAKKRQQTSASHQLMRVTTSVASEPVRMSHRRIQPARSGANNEQTANERVPPAPMKKQLSTGPRRFQPEVRDYLEKALVQLPYHPSKESLEEISKQVGLRYEQVRAWFSNKRQVQNKSKKGNKSGSVFMTPAKSHQRNNRSPTKKNDNASDFTPSELELLEKEFEKCNAPHKEERVRIAHDLSTTERRVDHWFMNRKILARYSEMVKANKLMQTPTGAGELEFRRSNSIIGERVDAHLRLD